jgi:hypothetical protein
MRTQVHGCVRDNENIFLFTIVIFHIRYGLPYFSTDEICVPQNNIPQAQTQMVFHISNTVTNTVHIL